MIRNFIGIIFFTLSGFFIYMLGLYAFFDFPNAESKKFLLLGGIFILLMIFHLIGLAFYRGTNWKTSTGITLLVGEVANIFTIILQLSMKISPEIVEIASATNSLNAFSDYLFGFIIMIVFIALGLVLYKLGETNK